MAFIDVGAERLPIRDSLLAQIELAWVATVAPKDFTDADINPYPTHHSFPQ